MYVLHDSKLSGNAWKVRILLTQLSLPFRRVTYVLPEGKTRLPEYLAKNPVGKVPVLELPSGEALFESNAMLFHLAEGTPYLPGGLDRARVLQWMFFDQSEALKALAGARFWIGVAKQPEKKEREIPEWHAAGHKALGILDGHLAARDFLVADRYTIADLANFPYVSMAHQGDFEMSRFPNVLAWIDRVKAQPGFVPLIQDEPSQTEAA